MRFVVIIVFSLTFLSCERKTIHSDSEIFRAPESVAELTDKKLAEVSGLAASANNQGLLWTHNDSGNSAIIYLVDNKLKIKLACKLKGVKNRDWEDISVGPGDQNGKNYVYIADIGDNDGKYFFKYIYRFEEPILNGQDGEITITEFDTIVFRLEGERKDTEAIMIHPQTKDIYVISKREKPVYVYQMKYPFKSGDTLTATKVMPLPLTQIVSAGISADGSELLMKSYDNIYYWSLKEKSIAEALKAQPQKLKYIEEPQGEAITFARDGSGFYTLSEKLIGEKTFLYFYARGKP